MAHWQLLVPALLACSACAGHSNAKGTVAIAGSPTLGTWTQTVDDCVKSEGITLLHQGTAVIAVGSDPVAGNSVELPNPQGGPPTQLFAQSCRTLEVDLYLNGTVVTDSRKGELNDQEINGSVTADCDLPGGGTLQANATFANCL